MSYASKALSAASALLMGTSAIAAPLVLEGNYVKIGVNDAGTVGSGGATSPGIQYDSTGTATFNPSYDYLTPGNPFEGFVVRGKDGSTVLFNYYNNNNSVGGAQITGTLVDYSGVSYNGVTYDNRAIWSGSKTEFNIEHDYRFNDNQQFVDINSRLEFLINVPTLYFGRFTDPDARAAAGDSSITDNTRGYAGGIPATNVVLSEALVSKYALGLFTGQIGGVNSGISASWSTNPEDYYNGTNGGPSGDHTIGLGFMFSGVNAGDIINIQYAYIFGPSAFAAGSGAVSGGAGGSTPTTFTVVDAGSASTPTTPTPPPAPTVAGTSTSDSVSSSTASSTRTETSYITRNVTDTDADGNPVTRTYVDTVVTTIPVTTITITTIPVTTTTYSDGSTTSSSGTPIVTTSTSDGTGTSSITGTILDATAVTRMVTTSSNSSSTTTETRTVARTVTDTDASGNPRTRTYTDTILDTTPVTTTTTTSTPVTTIYYANGTTSVIEGTSTSSSFSSNGTTGSSVIATALDSSSVTATVANSSTSRTTSSVTRNVTRTVTDTDADGNPVTRTYTDTIVDTTPTDTVTITTTPVNTTNYSNGSTTTSSGTPIVTSSSTTGSTTSVVTATSLDATAVTRPSILTSNVQSTILPVVKVSLTEHVASENKGVQKITRHKTTTTTVPMIKTTVTTPVTTTSYSNGTKTLTNGTPATTYELWNDVGISHYHDALFGRVDQLEVLDGINDGINGLLNHEPSKTKERFRVFENNRFVQSYNADGYSAHSKIFGGGFEVDLSKGWTVGYQYNQVNINLRGVDSSTQQTKGVHGIFNTFHGNTFSLNTNVALANSKYNYNRTVESVFSNVGSTTGNEWWVSNRLYMHVTKWLSPFVGHTIQNVKRNSYAETGSIQSARTVEAHNQTTHIGEAGLKLETRFGGKKKDLFGISVDGAYGTDNSYGVTASVDYKEILIIEGSHGVNNGVTNNSIAGKVKFRF